MNDRRGYADYRNWMTSSGEGDPKRRANTTQTDQPNYSWQGLRGFRPDHVDLFDGMLTQISSRIPSLVARAELAERLSLLVNAPRGLVGRLAREDEVAIAGPLLRRSPVIDDVVLIEIARLRGQGHLLAMSERPTLSSDLTDVIVRRGDRDVVRSTARNAGAAFSQGGYSTLVKRASHDGVSDAGHRSARQSLGVAAERIDRRLDRDRTPWSVRHGQAGTAGGDQGRDQRTFGGFARLPQAGATSSRRSKRFWPCMLPGELNEAALFGFARSFKYEESIAALSAISAVKIATLDDLISGERHDPILIIGKTIGLEWATVRALILLRLGPNRIVASADIENARLNFNRLMPSTAERVVSFWKTRQPA